MEQSNKVILGVSIVTAVVVLSILGGVFLMGSNDGSQVKILTPSDGSTISGLVKVEVSSPTIPVLLIDGSKVTTNKLYSWDTTKYLDGDHTIEAIAEAGSDRITVTINNSNSSMSGSPTVTFTSPLNNSVVSGTINITVSVMDDVDQQLVPKIFIDSYVVTTASSYAWNTEDSTEGWHTLKAEATDSDKRMGSTEIRVQVNNTKPPVGEPDPGKKPSDLTVYISGNETWVETNPQGGYLMQGGGTDNNDAFRWFLSRADGGDVVVIRVDDSDGYNNYFYSSLGNCDSVHTLVVDSRQKADYDYTKTVVRNAEALFIAGGDQSTYYNYWAGTGLEQAIQYLATTKKVSIGGTSAGMAILGQFAYIPRSVGVISAEALGDPYHRYMDDIKDDFLNLPLMQNILTDTHFSERNRLGRTITFMARLLTDGMASTSTLRAIACDEYTSVAVSTNGTVQVFGNSGYDDYVYFFIVDSTPDNCVAGEELHWVDAVSVYKVRGYEDGRNTFNLLSWSGEGGAWYSVNVLAGAIDNNIQTPD